MASLLNAETGGTLTLEAAYEYDPFGNLMRNEGSYAASNNFRFSTKFADVETGLVYYGLRYYSPTLGRFINKDPIEEQGGLNLYGFCGNNGINHWDLLGQSWLSKLWKKVKKYVVPVIAIVAAVVTYGAVSNFVAGAIASSTGASAGTAALATGAGAAEAAAYAATVTSVATTTTTVTTIAGVAGGAVAGVVGQVVATGSTDDLGEAALSGAVFGGIAGGFGDTWNATRVASTTAAGGLVAEANGGDFSDGALVAGVVSLVTYGAVEIRGAMVDQSKINFANASGVSDGFNGDGFKLGGGRYDPNLPANGQVPSPLGGIQGGLGQVFGRNYCSRLIHRSCCGGVCRGA